MTLPLTSAFCNFAVSSLRTPKLGSKLMDLLWSSAGAGVEATFELSASGGPSKSLWSVCCWWCCDRESVLSGEMTLCVTAHSFLFLLYRYSKEHAQSLYTRQTSGSPESGLPSDALDSPRGQPVLRSVNPSFCLWLPCVLEKTFLHTKKQTIMSPLSLFIHSALRKSSGEGCW